nr:PREDICTED: uncharacterized protein LOC107398076 [Tribolium castaneum]|eukprot:XP_015836417.1 PREDICTED: uncharacterized protein LOC107398076 [Tribolium castaneum]
MFFVERTNQNESSACIPNGAVEYNNEETWIDDGHGVAASDPCTVYTEFPGGLQHGGAETPHHLEGATANMAEPEDARALNIDLDSGGKLQRRRRCKRLYNCTRQGRKFFRWRRRRRRRRQRRHGDGFG